MLKSPTIIVLLSISPFMLMFALCITCFYDGCKNIYLCYVFFLDWSLDHNAVSFLSLAIFFKTYLFFWYENCYSGFLLISAVIDFFFPSSYFHSVCVSMSEVGICWYIYGFCVWIHSASLHVLVGTFNPFTLRVIIVIYFPIGIFCIVLDLFLYAFSFAFMSFL